MDITKVDIGRDPEFEEMLKSIHYSMLDPDNQDDDVIEITPLRIVSVVVCTELKDTLLDLKKIFLHLDKTTGENGDGSEEVKYEPVRPSKNAPKERGKKKMFYNCLLWKVQVRDGPGDHGLMNVSIKCFPNGKFQYAGFNTIHAINLVTRIVSSRLREIEGAMTPNVTKIERPSIIQINSCFYILKSKKWLLKQITLNRLLLDKEHISVGGNVISSTFIPEKYPGINVKFRIGTSDKKLTLLIFATGSVLINGYNDLYYYREAYYMICKLVHQHRSELITENFLS
mgnify:CR=1 FL=1|tara:strand:- start:919 stop:1773 length:855 start_codon:yes stop_codon:yes gene_type:complete